MSRSTISTFQLFEMFPDEASARQYLEDRLWPDGPRCPGCKATERITTRKGGFYRCNPCQLDFTVRTGTIFGRSHIPLHKWVHAMYLLVTARKGISSLQLAKQIGISQHAAWFMLQRLREACSSPDNIDKLRGVIEIDEAHHLQAGDRVRYDEGRTCEDRLKNVPIELDKMSDAVLGYRPKNKAKNLRPKKRKKAK